MWKVFAVVMAGNFGFGLTFKVRDIIDVVAIPIDGIAVVGLFVYAFHIRRAYTHLWTLFGWLFAAWSAMMVIVGVMRGSMNGAPVYAIVGALSIVAALTYFNWLALCRLGRVKRA